MAEFMPLDCPNCGARLEVTDDLDRFACAYCKTQLMVRRRGGIVSLKPVVDELKGVRVATDKTASELAITRLTAEIYALQSELKEVDVAAQVNDTKGGLVTAVRFFGVLAMMGLCGLLTGLRDVGAGMLLLFGILCFLCTLPLRARKQARVSAASQTHNRIEPALAQKQAELAHHQQIVGV